MSKARAMCTIFAKNYVAVARTLCQSFLRHHPDGKCYALIVDDYQGFIDPSAEPFEIVNAADLNIPNLAAFCFKYNVIELSTAFKPFLMNHLIREKGLDSLLYLDPDIQVINPLDGLYQSLAQYDIVITPHLDRDFPDDLVPNLGDILRHGTYNLGFIGVSSRSNSLSFLNWWQDKLYDKCIMAANGTYFVDQKFIDLVPLMFDNVLVEQGVGYNVAFWNLHSRHIARRGGLWHCNDDLLYFFHFSSYDPSLPELITKPTHANRHRMADLPEMADLVSAYRASVLENGYTTCHRWPYSFGFFDDGKPISNGLREKFRLELQNSLVCNDPFSCSAMKHHAARMEADAKVAKRMERSLINRGIRKAYRAYFLAVQNMKRSH